VLTMAVLRNPRNLHTLDVMNTQHIHLMLMVMRSPRRDRRRVFLLG